MHLDRILSAAVIAVSLTVGVTSAQAIGLVSNEFETGSQVAWGDTPAPGNISQIMVTNFGVVFAPTDLLEIGIPGTAGFSMIFDEAQAVTNYLPQSGTPAALTADLLDPVNSASGVLGGEVLTLALNIAYSDAGLLPHPNGVAFGDLILTALTGTQASMNGLTVRELFSEANILLGGGTVPNVSFSDAFEVTNSVDMSFNGGPISTFGMNDLELPLSAETPLPGTLPMFLGGAGLIGLLGWRRRRQASAFA